MYYIVSEYFYAFALILMVSRKNPNVIKKEYLYSIIMAIRYR